MNLLQAIRTLNKGRKQRLKIIHCGNYYVWDPTSDKGWQEYKEARWILSKYKLIHKLYPEGENIMTHLKSFWTSVQGKPAGLYIDPEEDEPGFLKKALYIVLGALAIGLMFILFLMFWVVLSA